MSLSASVSASWSGFAAKYTALMANVPLSLCSDLDLPQSVRDGLDQQRKDIDSTRSRVKESEARIDADLEPFIKKNYW